MSASTDLTAENFSRMVQKLVTDGCLGFVEAVYRVTDELTEQEIARSGIEIACEKGCSFCCSQIVTVADDEWLAIEKCFIRLPEATMEKLYRRTKEILPLWTKWWRERRDESHEHPEVLYRDWAGIACVFLNEEGACDIYPVRPIDCRRVSSPVRCQTLDQPGRRGFTFPWHAWALQLLNDYQVQEYHRQSSTPLLAWMQRMLEQAEATVTAELKSPGYLSFEKMIRAVGDQEGLSFVRAVYTVHDRLRQEAAARAEMAFACQKSCNLCCHQLICLSPMAWKEVEKTLAKLQAATRKKLEKRVQQVLPRWQRYTKQHANLLARDPFRVYAEWDGTACPFLNNEGLCDIYESRPFVCRSYTNTKRCRTLHLNGATQFHYPFDTWTSHLLHREQGKLTSGRDVSPVFEWLRLRYGKKGGKRLRIYVCTDSKEGRDALIKFNQG